MSDREAIAAIVALGIASDDHPRIIADSILEYVHEVDT